MAAAPGAHAAGMPQLDFRNPLLTGQVIWGAGIFLFFYLALRGWALPKVDKVLVSRSERINGDLDQARAAKVDADSAVRELNETKKAAAAEAQAHLDAVLDEERRQASSRLADLGAKLEVEIAAAEKAVAEERSRALASLKPIASDVAEALVQKLTGTKPDRARIESAVAKVTAEKSAQSAIA
jgi:F-type H+-transporting ATPase subunit b